MDLRWTDFMNRHFLGSKKNSKWPEIHKCNFDLDRLLFLPESVTSLQKIRSSVCQHHLIELCEELDPDGAVSLIGKSSSP
jgi:hypothetical protein